MSAWLWFSKQHAKKKKSGRGFVCAFLPSVPFIFFICSVDIHQVVVVVAVVVIMEWRNENVVCARVCKGVVSLVFFFSDGNQNIFFCIIMFILGESPRFKSANTNEKLVKWEMNGTIGFEWTNWISSRGHRIFFFSSSSWFFFLCCWKPIPGHQNTNKIRRWIRLNNQHKDFWALT